MESDPSTSSSPIQWSQPCRQLEFFEILSATENFDESLVIGIGGFGKVYKGNLTIGASLVVVAVKRLDSMSNQGVAEFWAEVEMLSMLRHCNIVSLIGYCNHEQEKILVYEYMPNRTLNDHLHTLNTPLSWLQRLNICIGAGRGLHYLHTGTGIKSGVIHRDVKSSNILLHESWAAKISDFGLSKVGPANQPSTYVNTLIKGTFGYLDPDYFTTGRLTRKSDVYAFGVVLLEVLCRKRAVDRSLDEEQWGLVTWVQDSIKEGNLKRIIDPNIRGEISSKCLKDFITITKRCLHNSPKLRPTIAEVVVSLESIVALQDKFNNSFQRVGKTIFGRMVNMFSFPSKRSIVCVDNNMLPKMKDVPVDFQSPSPSVKEFSFDELSKATKSFTLILARGAFGKVVFLGWVDKNTLAPSKPGDGIVVAIKMLNHENRQSHFEWRAEANLMGQLAHPNIIRLLGYCITYDLMTVYEYMPNKSLDLFVLTDDTTKQLSWGTRLQILIGVAHGLAYLHSIKLIHRDVKLSNILLDEDFNAKLGGFGFAKYIHETDEVSVSSRCMGTTVYLDPEYYMTGHLNMKSDIYNFGGVLLETITGQTILDVRRPEGQENLVNWASSVQSSNIKDIMDPRLENNYPLQDAFECVSLALRHVAYKSKDRPSIEEVLQSLEQIYALYK
ncbi:putative protein kinase RLK-Pelle-CrRLK1L-1 family [Helianthus annuus]|uniref:Putative serine-threonine/tyrosine-protein kinase catalytic domain-containing protein n=1 Tax=Helianthus annuus TaxID=4232 RepID=A0A251RUI0_HELAN|nr:probable serine/threonine-protein kinase PBL19 [Helianthus annuus]KAF5757475.1 putative protein kinase RLK-Pelle-CrRLK1L-1 family [Helianthus annuus]KAJ0430837.1 putative protein kinase RLK-Pelle-CrRLK1L-1 family [Helianthus annuus]